MARSLGLAAYRALARRGEAQYTPPLTPAPDGELVWLHAAEPGNLLAVQDLGLRLATSRPGLQVLITLPRDHADIILPRALAAQGLHQTHLPGEHPSAVATFLDFWNPDLAIWVWGGLQPNILLDAAGRGIPLFLIDADTAGFDARRSRWLPDLTRQILGCFDVVMARSRVGQRRLINLGLSQGKVNLTSALLAGGQALACADTDLTDLSSAMRGRPAWFAAAANTREIPVILAAHRNVLRFSHRLLLVLNIASAHDRKAVQDILADHGMTCGIWDDGTFPDETTQVLITEDPQDRGLFFRIAPVSFMGSTLFAGKEGCDPLDAAALGSAILYGPKVRHFLPSYSRLAAAGAARIVNDADALTTAVSRLIAPDQAAAMAHAGWDVISRGATLADRVVDLAQDALDKGQSTP